MIAHISFDIEFLDEEQKKSLRTCLEETASHFVGKRDTLELREAAEKSNPANWRNVVSSKSSEIKNKGG